MTHRFLTIFAVALFPATVLAGEKSLVDFVCQAHTAAVQSIRSVSCRVALTEEPPPGGSWPLPSVKSYHYLRSDDMVRVTEVTSAGSTEHFFSRSRLVAIDRNKLPSGLEQVKGSVTRGVGFYGTLDPYVYGKLSFIGPNHRAGPLRDLLSPPSKLWSAGRVTDGGIEYVRLDVEAMGVRSEFWFDSTVNYLVRKHFQLGPDGKRSGAEAFVEYTEVAPGTFFPTQAVTRFPGKRDGTVRTQHVRFEDVRVNEPVPPDRFQPTYQHGMSITDSIAGRAYFVDANGREIAPDLNTVVSLTPPPLAPSGEVRAAGGGHSVTRVEPGSPVRWILPMSLCVLAAAGVIAAVRRLRGGSRPAP